MDELQTLKEKLLKELKAYGLKETLTVESLSKIDTLAHAIKSICKIMDHDSAEWNNGYSNAAYPNYRMNPQRTMPNQQMYGGRYSKHDETVATLYSLMSSAPDEMTRMELQNTINRLESR